MNNKSHTSHTNLSKQQKTARKHSSHTQKKKENKERQHAIKQKMLHLR